MPLVRTYEVYLLVVKRAVVVKVRCVPEDGARHGSHLQLGLDLNGVFDVLHGLLSVCQISR